jgi:WhiB family redox-sensing transcriptional regulator
MSDDFLEEITADLDRFEHVPDDVLLDVVTRDGRCMWFYSVGEEPDWSGDDLTDRELAARVCAGCPVRRPCLELELRTTGYATSGVWGALSDEDRRALLPRWLARREANGHNGGEPR